MQLFTRYEFSPLCQFLNNQLSLAAPLYHRGLSNTYLCPYCHQVESRFHLFSCPAYAPQRPDCFSECPLFLLDSLTSLAAFLRQVLAKRFRERESDWK